MLELSIDWDVEMEVAIFGCPEGIEIRMLPNGINCRKLRIGAIDINLFPARKKEEEDDNDEVN